MIPQGSALSTEKTPEGRSDNIGNVIRKLSIPEMMRCRERLDEIVRSVGDLLELRREWEKDLNFDILSAADRQGVENVGYNMSVLSKSLYAVASGSTIKAFSK